MLYLGAEGVEGQLLVSVVYMEFTFLLNIADLLLLLQEHCIRINPVLVRDLCFILWSACLQWLGYVILQCILYITSCHSPWGFRPGCFCMPLPSGMQIYLWVAPYNFSCKESIVGTVWSRTISQARKNFDSLARKIARCKVLQRWSPRDDTKCFSPCLGHRLMFLFKRPFHLAFIP